MRCRISLPFCMIAQLVLSNRTCAVEAKSRSMRYDNADLISYIADLISYIFSAPAFRLEDERNQYLA